MTWWTFYKRWPTKKLNEKTIQIDPRAAATMVAVSRGYPGSYEKGFCN